MPSGHHNKQVSAVPGRVCPDESLHGKLFSDYAQIQQLDLNATKPNDVKRWLNCLKQLHETDSCPSPAFWRPFHIATLAAHMRRHRKVAKIPDGMERYAARMHLWQAVGVPPPTTVTEHDSTGKFAPLRPLVTQNMVDSTADELVHIVSRQSGGQDALTAASLSLQELLSNCFDHSEPSDKFYGLACAQAWPNGKLAQVVIADTGIGIRRSLNANAALRNRLLVDNACELATLYGISSKPGQGHSGYGLTLARDLLKLNEGSLIVISGEEGFYSGVQSVESFDIVEPWQGTVVIFEWRTDRNLSAKTVYANWPDVEEAD